MRKKFEAHGTLDVTRQGQIFVVEGTGPWNLESLYQSGDEAAAILEQLKGTRWAVLAIFHGECIYVPAAARRLSQIVSAEKQAGRVATALLVNGCDSPNFAQQHIGEIYTNAGEQFAFFDDIDLARKWLQKLLAQDPSKDTFNTSTL